VVDLPFENRKFWLRRVKHIGISQRKLVGKYNVSLECIRYTPSKRNLGYYESQKAPKYSKKQIATTRWISEENYFSFKNDKLAGNDDYYTRDKENGPYHDTLIKFNHD
jgi:hypothetical protein